MAIGIESFGAYIPLTRLPLSVIAGHGVREGGHEKAVAWADEDSITMATAAGVNCLREIDRDGIDSLIFASTCHAFVEKQSASIAAKVLDLRSDVRTTDIGGSLRAGLLALQQAIDSVSAGSARKVLVLIADCRMAAPKSNLERLLGDGAAAFLVSSENVIAELTAAASQANEMMDTWRRHGDNFVHSWEDRFVNLHGYKENTLAAVRSLFSKSGTTAADFQRVCYYAPDPRNHRELAKALRFSDQQVQNPMFDRLGNTGAAFAPMQLIAALEQTETGEAILVSGYGDGADALAFRVVAELAEGLSPRRGMAFHLQRRRVVDNYDKYLYARNLTIQEYPTADDQGISATVQYRNRDENLTLQGQVCGNCGTHQFPKGRVCVRCKAKDHWSPMTYAGHRGKVLTYTLDAFYPSPEPPTVAAIIEVVLANGDSGPRIHMQLADGDAQQIKIGLEVEFAIRVVHRAGKRPNYFWKCLPLTASIESAGESTGKNTDECTGKSFTPSGDTA